MRNQSLKHLLSVLHSTIASNFTPYLDIVRLMREFSPPYKVAHYHSREPGVEEKGREGQQGIGKVKGAARNMGRRQRERVAHKK